MTTELDPSIQQKLRAFALRRRRLIVIKGVLAALAMLLLTMLAVAAIDLIWLLPDWLRWTLSGVAYLSVLVVVWRACVRQLLHAPDERQLARLIEHAEPGLREDLLSAVELGRTGGQVFDSEQFRALLQTDVAHRMEGLEVKTLLPVALIRRTIGYAAMIGVAALAMMFASGWRFHTLLLRALFPGANLERVSRTKVIVHEPESGDRIVPQGDTVRVEVELAGEPSNRAKIETMSDQEGWQVMDMQPLGGNRFAATVQVSRASVRYRIKAGDALTRKYLLDARERPYVAEFQKTFHYPAYSEIPEQTVTEREGGIVALEGTEVVVKVRTNQAVTKAEFLIDQGKTSSTVALTPAGEGWLAGKITLSASGSYRVHLVGAETGFENKFSPENELRAEPDLLPAVELEQPKNDLILPANELVDVAGNATDDFGIAKVSRLVKVNDGGWKETVLSKKPGKKTRVEDRWDLFEMGVKPGDLLTMKLAVTDLKGHKGESRPLQVTITASGFETRRLQWLEQLRALNESVRVLFDKADDLAKTGRKMASEVQSSGGPQAIADFKVELADFETKSTEAWTSLGAALRGARDGHSSAELATVGRLLSRVNLDGMKLAKTNIEAMGAGTPSLGTHMIALWTAEGCSRVVQRTRLASDAVKAITMAEEAAILWENSEILLREQRRLMELAAASGNDAVKWAPVIARLRVLLSQTKVIEDLAAPIAGQPGKGYRDWAKDGSRLMRKHRDDLAGALKLEGTPDRRMLQRLSEFNGGVQACVANFGARSREFSARPVALMREMSQETFPVYGNVERLLRDMETIGKERIFPAETRAAMATGRWAVRGEFFKQAGDIEEVRQRADNHFVGDLRSATVALASLQALAPGGDLAPVREKLASLEAALRVLESGHDLLECMDGFNQLAVAERWDVRSLAARTDAPRDWRWLESRMRFVPDELGRARPEKASEELKAAFAGAQDILRKAQQLEAWRGLDGEMQKRGNAEYPPLTARKDAEQLAGQVKLALDLFRKHMEEARRTLAKVAPTVSELASALAREQKEAKKETEKHAAEAPEKKADEAKAESAKQLARQQDINKKVETLKDLVRAEANKQDILNKDQRELMRDADDALAMLKDPPPKAEQALQDAAADAPEQQKADLERAGEQQGKLADALEQIAKHFEAKEQGKPLDETRTAMRENEKELGIKEELDQQQAKAQMLAEMAAKTPEQLLAELEAKLPENPAMQKELSAISKDALVDAEQKLSTASKQEDAVAKQVAAQAKQENAPAQQAAQNAAQAAKEAVEAAKAAGKAAQEAQQSAKTAGNPQAEQQAAKAGEEAAKAAQQAEQAVEAAGKMAAAPNAQQAADAAKQTAQKAGEAAKAATQAMDSAKQAANAANQAAQKGGEQQVANQTSDKKSGEAAKQAEKAAAAAKRAENLAQDSAAQAAAMAQAAKAAEAMTPEQAAKTIADAAKQAAEAAKAAQQAAQAAQQQAKNAGNQQAAQQAEKAANQAAAAAQNANQAAQAAEQMAKSSDPQQAAQSARQAAAKAGEAAQAAQQAAGEAQAAEKSAQQAAQKGDASQPANQQAAQQSGEAAKQAQAAAQAARQAQAAAQAAAMAQPNAQLANAAKQQQPVAANAGEAADATDRAGRHEARLGNQQVGEQLQQLADAVAKTAQQQVPAAQQALAEAKMAAQAQAPVNEANAQLAQELKALQNAANGQAPSQQGQAPAGQTPPQQGQAAAGQATPSQGQTPAGQTPPAQGQAAAGQTPPQSGAPASGQPPAGAPASPAEQQAMARALDALDQQLNASAAQPGANSQQGQQPGQQGQPGKQPGEPGQQPGQPGQQPGQPGQPGQQPGQPGQPSDSQSASQSAMAQAAQAAAASMRQSRAESSATQPDSLLSSNQSDKSLGGAKAEGTAMDAKALPNAQGLKPGEWGKLPRKLAEQLTKGSQEAIPGEYRQAVETYYRVLAEKAKQRP